MFCFQNKKSFRKEFSEKGDTDGVDAHGARKGYRKGTLELLLHGRLKKGGSICRLATMKVSLGYST